VLFRHCGRDWNGSRRWIVLGYVCAQVEGCGSL
jgi:hypothetical protein